MIASATLLLPLPRLPEAHQQERESRRHLRDLTYKPDLFVDRETRVEALIREKQQWIQREGGATHAERVERFERIRALNAQLLPFVASDMAQTRAALDKCRRQVLRHEVAARRDFPFSLYPEPMLREFFQSSACGFALT
jgi:hypothetical protein